jgi:hypothetical protein
MIEPKYEEFQLRTIWSLSNAFTSAYKRTRSDAEIQGHNEAGQIPGTAVLTVVLTQERTGPGRFYLADLFCVAGLHPLTLASQGNSKVAAAAPDQVDSGRSVRATPKRQIGK